MTVAEARRVVENSFLSAGYKNCEAKLSGTPLVAVYEGGGMVWGVSISPTFEFFEKEWTSQSESAVAELLSQVASPEEKWNLTVLVLIQQALEEGMLPSVSRFQEDPAFYARFVVFLDGTDPKHQLKEHLAFLLLRWLDSSTERSPKLTAVEADLMRIVTQTAAQVDIATPDTTSRAIIALNPEPEAIVSAILEDFRGNEKL